jgi:hypothetical protein
MRMTNIAVPFIALVALVAVDRVFHPHPRRAARTVCGAAARPLPPTVDQVVDSIAAACSGPDGVEVCGPPVFAATFAHEMPGIGANRRELEHRWLDRLGAGDRDAAFGLAYLRSVRALPLLRLELLNERHFYGWESSRRDAPDVLYADEQYPRQLALISAIEHISRRPVTSVVRLSPDERRWLQRDTAHCDRGAAARWLLHKLEGAPLPTEREIAAARSVCDQRD